MQHLNHLTVSRRGFPHRDEPTEEVGFHSEGNVPYGVFSLFAPFMVFVDAKQWPTAEHYYQAQKFAGTPYEERVRAAAAPGAAGTLAAMQPTLIRRDWEEVKDTILERACYAKFTQHPDLQMILLSTGNARIMDRSPKGGAAEGEPGANRLGKTLQAIRQQIFLNCVATLQRKLLKQGLPELQRCPRGGRCKRIDDAVHCAEYCHPCPRSSMCADPSPWHLQQFVHHDEGVFKGGTSRHMYLPEPDLVIQPETLDVVKPPSTHTTEDDPDHLPICTFMMDCKLQDVPGHDMKYSHLCSMGSQCTNKAPFHKRQYYHPTQSNLPMCVEKEGCRRCGDIYHVMRHTHPCGNGVRCTNFAPVHIELHTHIIPPCGQGKSCWKRKYKDHMAEATHPCPKGAKCTKKADVMHARMFSHEGDAEILMDAEETLQDAEIALHNELLPPLEGSHRGSFASAGAGKWSGPTTPALGAAHLMGNHLNQVV